MRAKLSTLLVFALVVTFLLSACQTAPEKNVVTSKNDGAFDTNAIVSAEETHAQDATQPVQNNDRFSSTDQSVEISINLDTNVTGADMPVVEVEPHYLTEAEAENAAHALFGNADFYEWQYYADEIPCKSEIQEKLIRWSEFTNQEAVDELYGWHSEDTVRIVKIFIDEYTGKLESAPENSTKTPCQWKFKKAPYYLFSAADAAAADNSKESDMLRATVSVNGVPFVFRAERRNLDDYKVNYISANIESDSPDDIDRTYFTAQLCRTDKPTDEQVKAVKAKAESILEQLQLGQWQIDNCYVETATMGQAVNYSVRVTAIPVLEGVATIGQQSVANLNESDVYASNYQMPRVRFQYSANGELVSFLLESPIDSTKVLNSNVKALGMDELMEKAKTFFELSTLSQYDKDNRLGTNSTNVKCLLNVNDVKYSLARIRVPETEASYYYVPALTLFGNAEFQNVETGETYFSNDNLLLLTLNAVDGTVINTTNS